MLRLGLPWSCPDVCYFSSARTQRTDTSCEVALEFILLLKDTLYAGVVPDRNKRATQNTLIQPWQKNLGRMLLLCWLRMTADPCLLGESLPTTASSFRGSARSDRHPFVFCKLAVSCSEVLPLDPGDLFLGAKPGLCALQ